MKRRRDNSIDDRSTESLSDILIQLDNLFLSLTQLKNLTLSLIQLNQSLEINLNENITLIQSNLSSQQDNPNSLQNVNDIQLKLTSLAHSLTQLKSLSLSLIQLNQRIETNLNENVALIQSKISSKPGNFSSTLQNINYDIKLTSGDSIDLGFQGEFYRQQGLFTKALEHLNEAIRLEPNQSFALASRGEIYRQQGEFLEAIKDLTKAIYLQPIHGFALASRGELYRQQGFFSLALEDLNKAIDLEPDNCFALASRGELYRQQGHFSEASQDLEKALLFKPNYGFALVSQKELFRQQTFWRHTFKELYPLLNNSPSLGNNSILDNSFANIVDNCQKQNNMSALERFEKANQVRRQLYEKKFNNQRQALNQLKFPIQSQSKGDIVEKNSFPPEKRNIEIPQLIQPVNSTTTTTITPMSTPPIHSSTSEETETVTNTSHSLVNTQTTRDKALFQFPTTASLTSRGFLTTSSTVETIAKIGMTPFKTLNTPDVFSTRPVLRQRGIFRSPLQTSEPDIFITSTKPGDIISDSSFFDEVKIMEIIRKLREGNNAQNNCTHLAQDCANAILTGLMPEKASSTQTSEKNDFAVEVFFERVKTEQGKTYTGITASVIDKTACNFPGIPEELACPQTPGGSVDVDAEPVPSKRFKQYSANFDFDPEDPDNPKYKESVNKLILDIAKKEPYGNSVGLVNLGHCNKSIFTLPGHMLVYMGKVTKQSDGTFVGKVWFIECQNYDGIKKLNHTCIFESLKKSYVFASTTNGRIHRFAFSDTVFVTPLGSVKPSVLQQPKIKEEPTHSLTS